MMPIICGLLLDKYDSNKSFSPLADLWMIHMTKPTHYFSLNKRKTLEMAVVNLIN